MPQPREFRKTSGSRSSTSSRRTDRGRDHAGHGRRRKIRVAGRGKGKSGGYRVVTYFAAPDIPVFMLAVINKGERTDLSKAEQNALKKELSAIADDYRAGMRRMIAQRMRRN